MSPNPQSPQSPDGIMGRSGIDTKSSPITELPHLANETWIQIFGHLGRVEIRQVSETSRLFHRLAESFLYSEFNAGRKLVPSVATSSFLQSLLNNSHRGSMVKHITLELKPFGESRRSLVAQFSPAQRLYISEQIHRLAVTPHVKSSWTASMLSNENFDAVAALLLLLVSVNVETLTIINCGRKDIGKYVAHLLSSCTIAKHVRHGSQDIFSRLRKITLVGLTTNSENNYLTLYATSRMLVRPSIRSFCGYNLRSNIDATTTWYFRPLESLSIHNWRADDGSLLGFVSSSPHLRQLCWTGPLEGCINKLASLQSLCDTLQELVLAGSLTILGHSELSQLCYFHCLQSLTIQSYTAFGNPMALMYLPALHDPEETFPFLTSASDILAVKHILLPRMHTFVEALPSTLKNLTLTDCPWEIFEFVVWLVTPVKKLAVLSRLEVQLEESGTKDIMMSCKPAVEEYILFCQQNGVLLSIV